MKLLPALLVLMLMPLAAAQAATFQAKRGISLDIWTTWPEESRWADQTVMLPFPEWRKTVKETDLKALKAAGFDFIRMPVDPSPFLSGKTVALRDRLYAHVLASARLIEASGLKVIIDFHWFPAGGNRSIGTQEVLKDAAKFAEYLELVRRMAGLIGKEDPQTLALELFNEPTIDCDEDDTNDWPAKLKQSHAAARAAAPSTTLILSGACWGGAEGLVKLDPKDFADENLVWSFHSYDPFILTHQGATWTGDFMPYVYGLPFPLHEAKAGELDKALDSIRARLKSDAPRARRSGMLAYLDEEIAKISSAEKLNAAMDKNFDLVSGWATKNGVDPANILLGEFGMIRQEYGNPIIVPAAARAAYYQSQINRAESRGFMWSMWSYGGAFGVVEAFEEKAAEGEVLEMVKGLLR